MTNNKFLFISQEIAPYISGTPMADLGRALPVSLAGKQNEVRTFMPKLGAVNERRNQLHEVIRLSGVNIPIDDNDHPLIIKVASMQPSRIQVYFIDNDDYFLKSEADADPAGSNRDDNDERLIFFARGVLETAKKLQWETDIIQCSGWFTALVPMYLKKVYRDGASFKGAKTVYCVAPGNYPSSVDSRFLEKLRADGFKETDLKHFSAMKDDPNIFHKMAINYSDAVVFATPEPDPELLEFANSKKLPVIHIPFGEADMAKYKEFYDSLSKSSSKK